jgi:branched-chain amino acid transport system permease protein
MQGVFKVPNAISPSKMQRLIFGIILILVATFRPNGLITAKNRKANEQTLKERSSANQQEGGSSL